LEFFRLKQFNSLTSSSFCSIGGYTIGLSFSSLTWTWKRRGGLSRSEDHSIGLGKTLRSSLYTKAPQSLGTQAEKGCSRLHSSSCHSSPLSLACDSQGHSSHPHLLFGSLTAGRPQALTKSAQICPQPVSQGLSLEVSACPLSTPLLTMPFWFFCWCW
jgi:hypothetical protein